MPLLPSGTRRKRITPLANLHEDDVWLRTFKLFGLEPLTPYPVSHTDLVLSTYQSEARKGSVSTMEAAVSTNGVADVKKESRIGFLDLPAETQSEVFKNVTSTGLVALSMVSKHFRDLASAHLYKNFHIVFPDEDDPSYESPIDGLAGGLDTFTTSEYDYAQYLKEIMLDTLSGGEKGERAYKDYTFDVSCGKFMNTLFLLTLRKAKALETFRWDLRVEISRPMFKALHALPALQNFHIRLHTGHSMYEAPPPLLSTTSIDEDDSIATTSYPLSTPLTTSVSGGLTKIVPPKIKPNKDKKTEDAIPKEPPTISGFRNLKSLAVLDMDNLDYIDEIRDCVRSSTSTLQKLKLSFSERLAASARKPPPPVSNPDDDLTDDEVDEFGNNLPAFTHNASSSDDGIGGPSKAYRANEERKTQEGVLARIFGLETSAAKSKDEADSDKSDSEAKVDEKAAADDPGKAWVNSLVKVSTKFQQSLSNSGTLSSAQKDAISMIEKAARQYVDGMAEKKKLEAEAESKKVTSVTTTAGDTPSGSSSTDAEAQPVTETTESSTKTTPPTSLPLRRPRNKNSAISDPDDIDLDAPEGQIDPNDFEAAAEDEVESAETTEASDTKPKELEVTEDKVAEVVLSPAHQHITSGIERMRADLMALEEQSRVAHVEATKLISTIEASHEPGHAPPSDKSQTQLLKLQVKLRTIASSMMQVGNDMEMFQHKLKTLPPVSTDMGNYVRATRGLQLKSLSIYLIPLKTTTLLKAIDFAVLEKVALLNVGPQDRLWVSLQKMNAETPLPLKKIFSDNVSLPLLKLINELPKVEELFLMEGREKAESSGRRAVDKSRPRATQVAPKTTVTIDQIRRLALKKHMPTLKRLVVNYFDNCLWDANEQTVKLICRKGKNLQELAIAMGVRATHTFNQYLPSLTNLKAMHILFYRNDDHCPFMIREIRKFVVDCCASNASMKLEYIALGNTVERIVRTAKKDAKTKAKEKEERLAKQKLKGKGKEVLNMNGIASGSGGVGGLDFVSLDALMGLSPAADADDESSDESEDEDDHGPGMKLETLEGVKFYDIYGVRIFCKDVLGGWL